VQYQLSRIVAGPFLHTIWRPKVTGAQHVPASGGAILAGNHLSVVDSVFLPLMLDRPVTFSAKAEYFTASGPAARLWAAYLKATNQLQMDRDGPRAAQDTLEAALALLQAGNLFDWRCLRGPDRYAKLQNWLKIKQLCDAEPENSRCATAKSISCRSLLEDRHVPHRGDLCASDFDDFGGWPLFGFS